MTMTSLAGPERIQAIQPLVMPRDEMAFRSKYEQMLLARTLTTVFRPGDRRWPNWRGYRPGETVTARVIARCGSDALGIAPEFTPRRIRIRIGAIDVLDPAALTPAHFIGSSPDVQDQASLLAHLFEIYGQPLTSFGGVVTRIDFAYRNGRRDQATWSHR
jgi:hypothetical protein